MFTATELKLLCFVNNGHNTVADLSERTALSQAQVYNVVRGLKRKSVLKDTRTIEVSENAYAIRLVNLLEDYPNLSELLSDSGIDILIEFMEPHTANDVIRESGLSKATVFRKIKSSRSLGVLIHDGDLYHINRELWPELAEFLLSAKDMRSVYDERVPSGSKILINKRDHVVYSNDENTGDSRTAFSYFIEKDGLPIMLDTGYYSTKSDVDPNTAFRDAFEIAEHLNDRRLRMGLLMEYEMRKGEIDVPDEFIAIYSDIANGNKVKGWPTLFEMKQRTEVCR